MDRVAILVPVLNRPHRVEPLLDSIEATTPEARVYFICDTDDTEERKAVWDLVGDDYLVLDGNYAEKINLGVGKSEEPFVFLGADDLQFHPDWFQMAAEKLDSRNGTQAVGVNDLIPRGFDHATHFLMTRAYAGRRLPDGSKGPLYEGYHHWYVDNEFIETAQSRGAYEYARNSVVEHLHPLVGKAGMDETYEIGGARAAEDAVLYKQREVYWQLVG